MLWGVGREAVLKFFGERGILKGPEEKKFVPYAGAEVTGDDKRALDSMRALACSLSVVATGRVDYSVCPRPDEPPPRPAQIASTPKTPGGSVVAVTGMQAAQASSCPGIAYGQTCVSCLSAAVPANVDKKQMTFDDFNQFLVGCAKGSNFADADTFCGKIPAAGWKDKYDITKASIETWFRQNAPADVKAKLNSEFWFDVDPSPLDQKKDYYVCADDDVDNEIYIYDDPRKDNDCNDVFRAWREEGGTVFQMQCTVTTFELPQKVTAVEQWIPWSGDPKYVAYYEAFPIGEEAFWQLKEGSFLIDVVFFGGVLNTIPIVGKLIGKMAKGAWKGMQAFWHAVTGKTAEELRKQAIEALAKDLAKELGEKVSKELAEQAAREMFEVFSEQGYQRLIQKDLLYDALISRWSKLENIGGKAVDDVAEDISNQLFERLQQNAIRRAAGKPVKTVEEIMRGIDNYIDEIALKGADVEVRTAAKAEMRGVMSAEVSSIIKAEFKRKNAIKQYLARDLLDVASDGTLKGLKAGALSKLFSRKVGSEVLEKLPAEARQQYMARAGQYMDDILKMEGDDLVINYGKILGTADRNVIVALKNQFEVFFRETYGSPSQWSGLIPQLSNPLKIGAPITLFGLKIPYLSRAAGIVWAPAKGMASNVYELAWRNRVGRYMVAYFIADALAAADSMNEKYEPHGKDNLVLNSPFGFDSNPVFPIPAAADFYANLVKEDGNNQRLFFASPCKADLTVTNTLGSCPLASSGYVVDYGYYTVPVEPGSISLLPGKKITTVWSYDGVSTDERTRFFDQCFNVWNPQHIYGDCITPLTKDPVMLDRFLHFFYDRVYVPLTDALIEGKMELIYDPYVSNMRWRALPKTGIAQASSDAWTVLTKTVGGRIGGGDYQPLLSSYWVRIILGEDIKKSIEDPKSLALWTKPLPATQFKKLAFEDFEQRMNALFEKGQAQWVIQDHMMQVLAYNAPKSILNELHKPDSFASETARRTFYHYHKVNIADINAEKMVKTCASDTAVSASDPYEYKVRRNIPTLSVKHDESRYSDYNEGYNYCISRYIWWTDWVKWIATGLAIAIDVGVGLIPGVGLIVEAPVAVLTGAGAAWVGKAMDEKYKWPK